MPAIPYRYLAPLALCLSLVACGGDDNDEVDLSKLTPIAALTEAPDGEIPGLVLTPQAGVRADLPAAQRLEASGDIEAATATYIVVAASNTPDSVEAKLAAGRLLLDLGRHQDARLLMEPFVAANPGVTAGLYLLARAYSGGGRWEDAAQTYERYVAAGGPAAAYAHLDRSYALLELRRPLDAVAAVQEGLAVGVPSSRERTFILAIAQSYERARDYPQAIEWFRRLIEQSNVAGDVAFALHRIVVLKQLMEDPSFEEELTRLLVSYPGSGEAHRALEQALNTGLEVDPNIAGLVYYRHFEHSKAEQMFSFRLEETPDSPEAAMAHYYLAAIIEVRGDHEAALEHYAKVGELDPGSWLLDDALWWSGLIYEREGDLEKAGELYGRLEEEHPASPFAADAAFRRGMLAYREERFPEAAAIWHEDLEAVENETERKRLTLWQAKALIKAGVPAAAEPLLEGLRRDNEDAFYGLRAAGMLAAGQGHPKAVRESSIDFDRNWDWEAAEAWLLQSTGVDVLDRSWESDPRWVRAHELWRVGRDGYGDMEIYSLFSTFGGNATAMYTMSRQLLGEGRVSMSGRAAMWLLSALDPPPGERIPRAILSLAYPTAFGSLVQSYAEAEGISPLLLLAFIRQESFFEPRAISPVGARGLTQVMPGTANEMAPGFGIAGEVSLERLLHAEFNIRFGARYMAEQLKRFNGEVLVALAAYNAGPGAAGGWRDAAGDDPDMFFETVAYDETRYYLEIVSENYAMYRYIYGGEPEPNLPR